MTTTLLGRVLVVVALLASLIATACRAEDTPRGGGMGSGESGPKLAINLPSGRTLSGQSSFSCRSLMEADMTASYDTSLTRGLEGKVSAGANAVSVQIEGPKTLAFLSQAGFSAGTARGPSFDILENTQDQLSAIFFDGSSVNAFVLNKQNGLAIWSKVRATFPGYDAPTGAQSYLMCQ